MQGQHSAPATLAGIVLLLPDYKSNLGFLVKLVRQARHTYEQAVTGQKVLNAVKATSHGEGGGANGGLVFDFVLMDIIMPMMEGSDVVESIRELKE